MGEAARSIDFADCRDDRAIKATIEAAIKDRPPAPANDAPLPLKRTLRPGGAYPVDALGSLMGSAVRAAAEYIGAPLELCAQSALANAALSVQGHVNVIKPWNDKPGPISLFLLSVAESGDRKTTSDEALGGDAIVAHETAMEGDAYHERLRYENEREAYDAAKAAAKARASKGESAGAKAIADALHALGDPPVAPLAPTLTFGDPTIEGLHKQFMTGQPSSGLFSTEGGAFVGGVGMSADNALKTAAQFSELWDGSPIKRLRAGDGLVVLRHRRLCFHLMMQPGAAHQWLSNPTLRDQGIFSRLLVAAPKSLAGTRFHRPHRPELKRDLAAFNKHLGALLSHPLPASADKRGELEPRLLGVAPDACDMLVQFSDSIERQMGPDGKLSPVKGLAGKASDHAVRLAAVVGLFENLAQPLLDRGLMARGIKLAQWYLDEALRLTEAEAFPPDLLNAEKTLEWLQAHKEGETFSLPCLYRLRLRLGSQLALPACYW